jgi:hypothetical protein
VNNKTHKQMAFLAVAVLLVGPMARADVVTDWNVQA